MLVWLASYPKSGNTWLRAILTALDLRAGQGLDINSLTGRAASRTPDEFEEVTGLRWAELPEQERWELLPPFVAELARNASAFEYRKTHDRFACAPSGRPLYTGEAGARAIYIVRDPRDVAISYAAHAGVSLDEIIERMNFPGAISGRQAGDLIEPTGTWSEHVSGWLRQSAIPMHLLRYEDMLADPVGAMGAVLDFIGCDHALAELERAIDAARFDKLKQLETERGFAERSIHARSFFREGKAGSWLEILTESQIARIEEHHAPVMHDLGYARHRAAAGHVTGKETGLQIQ